MQATSKDGTIINYDVSGEGPALLLISGISWFERWKDVVHHFIPSFTVYQMTRRGRGLSGDSPKYALEREVEDILAVMFAIGRPVNVLAHSFGGLCALEATLQKPDILKIILYEPPLVLNGPAALQPVLSRMQTLLDAGDREKVWETYMREISHLPETEIKRQRSLAEHTIILSPIHSLVREVRAVNDYSFIPERFKGVTVPTLLLLGSESSEQMKESTLVIQNALPQSRLIVLPGQKHFAMNTAPDLFSRIVLNYLSGKE